VNAGTGGIGTYWEFLAPGVASTAVSPVVRSGSFTVDAPSGGGTPDVAITISAVPSTGTYYAIVSQGGAGSPSVQVFGSPPIPSSATTIQVKSNANIAIGTVLNYIVFGTL